MFYKTIFSAMMTVAMVAPLSAQAHSKHSAWDNYVEQSERDYQAYRKYKKKQYKNLEAAWHQHIKNTYDFYNASYENPEDDYYHDLPYGVRKKLARQKHLPAGWKRKSDGRYCLTKRAYKKAPVVKRNGDGVIQVKVNNDVLTVIEATRQIIDVMRR